MPLPKPKSNEKKSEFVSRCISEVAKDPKFKDNKQRIAICYTQFDESKSEASVIAEIDGEEVLIFAKCSNDMEKNKAQEEPMSEEESPKHEANPKDKQEDMQEGEVDSAQKTYKNKKRSELKDSDFLFPDKRSFPIVSPQDVRDAINNFGRMGGDMSYDVFINKLYQKAKSKGPDFVAAIPESTKKEHKLGISKAQQVDMNALEMEDETPEQELQETNKDLYEMAVGSITSIKAHADNILNALNDLKVQENLTETWMQGKLAIAEDYLVTVHNYVMFNKGS